MISDQLVVTFQSEHYDQYDVKVNHATLDNLIHIFELMVQNEEKNIVLFSQIPLLQ